MKPSSVTSLISLYGSVALLLARSRRRREGAPTVSTHLATTLRLIQDINYTTPPKEPTTNATANQKPPLILPATVQ